MEKIRTANSQSRNTWLDCLRGLAACWVVLFHLNEVIPYRPDLYRRFASLGWLGVSIFFVVSGYCILLTAGRSPSAGQFLWRRLTRIWPPYVASLAVVLIVVTARKLWAGTNDITTLPSGAAQLFATIFLLTEPATNVRTMNWVNWSLTVEVAFYLVVALALLAGRWGRPLFILISILALTPGASEAPGLFFLPHWPLFLVGMGLYERSTGSHRRAYTYLTLGVIGAAVTQRPEAQIAALLTAASIRLSDWGGFDFPGRSQLACVGEWSYSLYLLHVPVGCYLLLRWREGDWVNNLFLHIGYDLSVLVACVAISALFFRFVENPSMKFSKSGSPRAVAASLSSRLRAAWATRVRTSSL